MHFSEAEIFLAIELKSRGLAWEPKVGHFVFDINKICPKSSPFQERVYFLLNYDCFMNHVGGIQRFRENMVWLPTWQDARELLIELGIPNEVVAQNCQQAMLEGRERLRLYELILDAISVSKV